MESYKHSCPVCGQHVEYTAGYCGRQMQCPICGNTIVFPAIPPKTGGKIIAVEETKPARKWAWNGKAIYVYLREYPHWNTVAQILVPFLIIGALLAGAIFVKNKFTDEPAPPPAPVYQGQAGGWDKMTGLARADQRIQQCLQSMAQARVAVMVAERQRQAAEKEMSMARGSQEHEIANNHLRAAENTASQAQKTVTYLRQRFEAEMSEYQKLGGTVDYRSKLPN